MKTEPRIIYSTLHVLICSVACRTAALARPLRRSWRDACQGTGRIKQTKKKQKKKVFNTKTPLKKKKKERRALTLAPHCTRPICFVPSYLPLPSEGEPLGAILGPSFAPMAPFLATAFKVLHCDVHGLDVCLVPYMQSYHYPCLLTIAGPVFVTSAALCLGL